MTEAKVVDFPGNETPIAEVPARERLGTLLARYRVAATKTMLETAEHLGLTEHALGEVERGLGTLSAGQLQAIASFLGVRYEPLLDAARDFHQAIWKDGGNKGGVQLSEMSTETLSLRQSEHELELELIKASDELIFVANVLRESSIRAEQAALRARELLAARGVEVPGVEPLEGPEEVECAGPAHTTPKKLTRGRDFVLAYTSDGDDDDPFYFCSKVCANAWAKREEAGPSK
jgi:transcriptional regulator with XRE-family HTH domain